ncbi:MAG: hypothetical protein FWH42_04215 [Dehalococcoidia bacterium]|nr:hypothetical protein [Dehalococcoidia bacterium]
MNIFRLMFYRSKLESSDGRSIYSENGKKIPFEQLNDIQKRQIAPEGVLRLKGQPPPKGGIPV